MQNKFKKFTYVRKSQKGTKHASLNSVFFFSVPQLAVVIFSMLPLLSVPLLQKLAKDNKKYILFQKQTNKQNQITQEQNQY